MIIELGLASEVTKGLTGQAAEVSRPGGTVCNGLTSAPFEIVIPGCND